MSLFQELKRRNVIRIAILYVVSSEDQVFAESPETPVNDLSIAVLPFADLHVASRTSSFAYRGSTLSIPEIANAIVRELTGKLGVGAERTILVEAATENVDAYEMYLTARELFLKRTELPESIRLFRQAIELDPSFLAIICQLDLVAVSGG